MSGPPPFSDRERQIITTLTLSMTQGFVDLLRKHAAHPATAMMTAPAALRVIADALAAADRSKVDDLFREWENIKRTTP